MIPQSARRLVARCLALTALAPLAAWAQEAAAPVPEADREPLRIQRTTGEIDIDGELGDAGWSGAEPINRWYETNPGDNIEPQVHNVGYLAYDDQFLYAAFEFDDPEPKKVRAPLGDRDNVPSYTDYGGLIIDATNDGKTAQMFLANARGIQYDAISSDASGEDSSPDFFWDSAAHVNGTGWTLEMRIPFSSLRYAGSDPEQWGIMLYRNRPRDFRYQMFTSRLPRDSTCFICNVRPLVGLAGLPSGSHWVAAPYLNASQLAEPKGDLGTPLESADPEGELGLDLKWLPNPSTVLDATINPDFSQIESDVAQIAANERFALFFPEKRPFFLESVDLFSTEVQAVYTRTFTQPRWGVRSTGTLGSNSYTLLVGQDAGGGSVIIPGSNSSDLAEQDFDSTVALGRWRHDFGQSFISMLYSGREIDGGGHNRVIGPDFRWQIGESDVITGQILFSQSDTPDRPDLADEWDGRSLSGHAAELWWYRQTETWDYFTLFEDYGDEFRADNGFVPQVGYRRQYGELGRTFRPEDKPVSRLRLFAIAQNMEDRDGAILNKGVVPGFGLDALWNSFVRFEFAFQEVRGIASTFDRFQVRPYIQVRPGGVFSSLTLDAVIGDEVDFANDRLGHGASLSLSSDLRPTDHLQLTINLNRRWLNVTNEAGASGRLFTADVARLRANYTFTARSWLRVIGQWVATERDPELYTFETDDRTGAFSTSAVFAFKLNWQTVLFVGWADNQVYDEADDLQPADRQLFLKVSYAFQR